MTLTSQLSGVRAITIFMGRRGPRKKASTSITFKAQEKVDLASVPLKNEDGDIALLNELGREGWELVRITANAQAYLRRQMEPGDQRRSEGGSSKAKPRLRGERQSVPK